MKYKTIPTETVDLAHLLAMNVNAIIDEGLILENAKAEGKFITLKFAVCDER